jgi:AcrR family transcriptional regulator
MVNFWRLEDSRRPDGRLDGRIVRAERTRARRREQVLSCARQVFAEKGYHATSIDDIISRAGIARGTFYLYFTNKRAIFEELLDGFVDLLTGCVRRISVAPEAPPPLEQMRDNVGRVLVLVEQNRELTKILLREAVGLDADFDRKLAGFYEKLLALIEGGVRLGQEMGLVRACDPPLVARCALGSIKEVVYHALVTEPDLTSRDHLAREIVDYTLRGLFR